VGEIHTDPSALLNGCSKLSMFKAQPLEVDCRFYSWCSMEMKLVFHLIQTGSQFINVSVSVPDDLLGQGLKKVSDFFLI
jgi:hypothetical protein